MKINWTLVLNARCNFILHHFLFIVLGLLIMVSCGDGKRNFSVAGSLSGRQGTKIILKEMTTRELMPVDSTTLDNAGNFSLEGYIDIVKFFSLQTSDDDFVTLLIAPGDEIRVSGEVSNLQHTYQVEGSEESQKIRELAVNLNNTLKVIYHLGKVFNDSSRSNNFTEIKKGLDSAYENVVNEHRNYTFSFIRKNLNSLASLMALYQQIGPHHYLLDPYEDFRYYQMVDSSLSILYPEAESVRELHRQVVEINEQKRAEEMNERYLGIGNHAPDIALPGPEGDTILLSSLKGKYILLDFWASWCPPCRQENPNLVRLYKRYHEKNFEIFQVSLDRSRAAWLKAIKDDQLDWIHVSDLKMWNSVIVPVYNLQGIPMNFLLNPEGVIIAKNLRGTQLGDKLKEIFND